ncbi:hypothetical protein IMZ48_00620 [Candidatus Bathyarchaeota archaeon]|nr:hypothetical protein [Candidatus Bathyarchaeota archaeon]
MKADCALPISGHFNSVFLYASKRFQLKLIRHIKNRRDRLKQLALNNLAAAQLDRLGLDSTRDLDSLAPQVIQLIEEHGFHVPEALIASRNAPSSVYQELWILENAELFFRAGFHDTDSWCRADAVKQEDMENLDMGIEYLHWLASHGAYSLHLKSLTSARDILIAHFTFLKIGENIQSLLSYSKHLGLDYFGHSRDM